MGAEKSIEQALQLYAESDTGCSLFNTGLIYLMGDGVQFSTDKFVEFMKRSSEKGYPPAMHNMGTLYQKGIFVKEDPKVAESYFRSAVDHGYSKSLFNLTSVLCSNGGNPVEIISTLEGPEFQDDPKAMFNLALYLDKHYTDLNEKIVNLYKGASNLGHRPSSINLIMKYLGTTPDDYGKNLGPIESMFENGDGMAAFYLGNIYLLGYGTDRDLQRAFYYFSKANDCNIPDASNNLGVLYASDLIGEGSYSIAMGYFNKVANFSKLANRNLQIMSEYPGYDFSKSKILKYQSSFNPISKFEFDFTLVTSDMSNENPYEDSIDRIMGELCFLKKMYLDAIKYLRKYLRNTGREDSHTNNLIKECVRQMYSLKTVKKYSAPIPPETKSIDVNKLMEDGWKYFYKSNRKNRKSLTKAKECFLEVSRLNFGEGYFGCACVEKLEKKNYLGSLSMAIRHGRKNYTVWDVQSRVNKVLGVKTKTDEDLAFIKVIREPSDKKYENLYRLAMDRYQLAYDELILLSNEDDGQANYQLGRVMASISTEAAYRGASEDFFNKSKAQGFAKASCRIGDFEAIYNDEEICPRCGSRLIILKGNHGGFYKRCASKCGYTTHTTTYVSTPVRQRTPEELFQHYCKKPRSKIDERYFNLDKYNH